jgi:glycosyltransferase involved in cell wall biosynthesis
MLGVSLIMERIATKQTVSDSVVHQHGIWTGISRVTKLMRKVNRTPAIVAPHGSLEQWALNKSLWKKRIALSLYEKNNLHSASCLHACSEQEVTGFRNFGLKNPIAVIPNGISHSWIKSSGDADAFRLKFNLPPEKHIMLFLSRISPVKGLPMLMEALNAVRQHLGDWFLLVAGSNEFNHQTEVLAKIKELQLKQYVQFTGLLTGQAKRDAFAAAEFFVLPSKREAAPVVILEALGAGIPALATKGAPWEDLVRYRCGWWTEVSADGIAGALKDAISCAPEQLRAMGARGKELVATNYTWTKSAKMTIELYEWLLGRRERPDFVILD